MTRQEVEEATEKFEHSVSLRWNFPPEHVDFVVDAFEAILKEYVKGPEEQPTSTAPQIQTAAAGN